MGTTTTAKKPNTQKTKEKINIGGQKLKHLVPGDIIVCQLYGMGKYEIYLVTNTKSTVEVKEIPDHILHRFKTHEKGVIIQGVPSGDLEKVNYNDESTKWRIANDLEQKEFVYEILSSIVYPFVQGHLSPETLSQSALRKKWASRRTTMREMLDVISNKYNVNEVIVQWIRTAL